jgi:hypothetical protein
VTGSPGRCYWRNWQRQAPIGVLQVGKSDAQHKNGASVDVHAALPTKAELVAAAQDDKVLRPEEGQPLEWLAEVNATVAALVERIGRRVNRTARRHAALAGTFGD